MSLFELFDLGFAFLICQNMTCKLVLQEVMHVERTVISYNATVSAAGKGSMDDTSDSWVSSLSLFAELRASRLWGPGALLKHLRSSGCCIPLKCSIISL